MYVKIRSTDVLSDIRNPDSRIALINLMALQEVGH